MSRLIRIGLPLVVFAGGVVVGPGFAGAQGPVAVPMCAPVPQCELPAVEENAANVGDNEGTAGAEYGYCLAKDGSILTYALIDKERGSSAASGCGSAGSHSGTTWYKPYGGAEDGTPATGNFNHKYDNEEHVAHCGGAFDDDCNSEVYETNSAGNHSFYHAYRSGRGWVGFNFSRTAARSFCVVSAAAHGGALRNECYYVYG